MGNRIIKFRAWQKYHKRMLEVLKLEFDKGKVKSITVKYPNSIPPIISHHDASDDYWLHDKDGEMVLDLMQFTGLTDKNGVEIYEGDVVWCRAGEHQKGIWEYEKQLIVEYGWSQSMWEMSLCDEIEVIGNIHDNPELMGEKK